MIGHELGGRYEVLTRIGGGGMALVYKAQDLLLGRNVAIKILRQQFVHDEEFIRRFRREAQSAASLSHPNVVSIYDVGQEEDTHYIVMEYVDGYNLNEYIKEKAPLQVEEAVHIASQICDALDHAHQNEIIHRDIKPHNILIGRNGRVKVTDFGIARAVTSSTITQTGSVLGSVHYFSPEHAKGITTGEKSDLYSLGIVLYQMLTARLPFLGESPISVALKHLQEEFEEPRLVNPLIPQSVENVILKSMRKNPQDRYQNAKEMLEDLETALLPSRRFEAKINFEHHEEEEDEHQTLIIPAIREDQFLPKKATGPIPTLKTAPPPMYRNALEYEQESRPPQLPAAERQMASPQNRQQQSPQPSYDEGARPKKTWVKPMLWIGVPLIVIALMVGVMFYVQKLVFVPEVTLPNLVNKTEDVARKELADLGIQVEEPVTRDFKDGFDKGVVYEQSKPEGTKVKKGSSISLSISDGVPTFTMPDLSSLTYAEARQKLIALKIPDAQIKKVEANDDSVEPGKLISQNPAPNTVNDLKATVIELTISKGSESVPMPMLVGKTEDEARAIISQSNLKLAADSGGVKYESSYLPKGTVIKQSPDESNAKVDLNTEVMIYVSSGYPPEALQYTYTFPVAPAEDGKKSTIKITYTDARGENMQWGEQAITRMQSFAVPLVLAPNKDGAVTVYRDGTPLDTYPVSYVDAKQGTVKVPQIQPPPSEDTGAGTVDPSTDTGAVTDQSAENNGTTIDPTQTTTDGATQGTTEGTTTNP